MKPDVFILVFPFYYILVPIDQGNDIVSVNLSQLKKVEGVQIIHLEPSQGTLLSLLVTPTRSTMVTEKGVSVVSRDDIQVYCEDSCILSSNYSSILDASFVDDNTLFLLMEGTRDDQSITYQILRILLSRSTVSTFTIHVNSSVSYHRISFADTQNVFLWNPGQNSFLFLSFEEHLRGILFSSDQSYDQLIVHRYDNCFCPYF